MTPPTNHQSGIGVVHNAFLLREIERTVVRGPFRPFPRSVVGGEFALTPKPPWFVSVRSARRTGQLLTRFSAASSLRASPVWVRTVRIQRTPGPPSRAMARHTGDMSSKWSIASEDSILSIASRGSVLSIGSVGSVGSIGSVGSALSVCSLGSALGAGSAMSFVGLGSVMSFASFGSVMSSRAAGSVMGSARRGPAGRWAAAQGLVITALAATAVLGARRSRR